MGNHPLTKPPGSKNQLEGRCEIPGLCGSWLWGTTRLVSVSKPTVSLGVPKRSQVFPDHSRVALVNQGIISMGL